MNPLRQHYRKLLYSIAGILLPIYIFKLILLTIGGSYASGGVASSTGILQGRDLLPLLYEKEQESAIAWCRQQTVLALHQLVSGPFSERRTFITTGGNNNGSFQHSSSVFHLEKLSPDNKRD